MCPFFSSEKAAETHAPKLNDTMYGNDIIHRGLSNSTNILVRLILDFIQHLTRIPTELFTQRYDPYS